jgi:hypothetical protein
MTPSVPLPLQTCGHSALFCVTATAHSLRWLLVLRPFGLAPRAFARLAPVCSHCVPCVQSAAALQAEPATSRRDCTQRPPPPPAPPSEDTCAFALCPHTTCVRRTCAASCYVRVCDRYPKVWCVSVVIYRCVCVNRCAPRLPLTLPKSSSSYLRCLLGRVPKKPGSHHEPGCLLVAGNATSQANDEEE